MYEWYQEKLAGEWFIWDNSERKFYKVRSKKLEDAVDLLNNQKATIDALRKDNNDLRELNCLLYDLIQRRDIELDGLILDKYANYNKK